jgi:squalene synthase HpnC
MRLNDGYVQAIQLAKQHYENFPVISFLIPKKLQKHIAIIYWFARTADDFADEGDLNPDERIERLNEFEQNLTNALNGNFSNSFEQALAQTIIERKLNPNYFYNLLKAFKQDVTKKRYSDFSEVLDYCRYSANPVGRLILELFDIRNDEYFGYSDKICTALQLTNFYQDLQLDYKKGRIYLPLNEMQDFDVSERSFELKENSLNLRNLLRHNISRTEVMFKEGRKLLRHLKGRLRMEIGWTILGGELILEKIKDIDYNTINIRPKITKAEYLKLILKTFFI